MVMEIIASLNLFAQANIGNNIDKGGVQHHVSKGVEDKVKPGKCSGDLWIKGICDPVCEQIFSGINDKDEARKKAERIFRETIACDGVCTCICEAICDEFV